MSVAYGGPSGGVAYPPPGRVNFGWISESAQLFGQAAGLWILGILLYGIVNAGVNAAIVHIFPNPNYIPLPGPFGGTTVQYRIQYGTNSNVTAVGQVVAALFAWLFGSFQAASLYGMAVKQVRGQSPVFSDIVGGGAAYGNLLILNILLFVCFFVGFFALCIGDLVVGAFLLPAAALAADGRSAGQALSLSVDGMKKDWLNGSLFVFVFFLLLLASLVPCGLGLFVTIPMLNIISALAYRDMIGMPGLNQPGANYGAAAPGVWPPPPQANPYALPQAYPDSPPLYPPPAPPAPEPPPDRGAL